MTQLTVFDVTLPWNPSDVSEGDYATSVSAENQDQAVRLVAEEMADSGAKVFDNDEEREDYIRALVDDGGEVVETVAALKYSLEQLFANTLFADGGRDIDIAALEQVLVENRHRFLVGLTAS